MSLCRGSVGKSINMGWFLQQQAKESDTVYALEYTNGKGKTTKTQLFNIILAEGVYAIWNERNKRIFEDKNCLIDEVVKKIAYVTSARYPMSINKIICHRKI